METPTWLIALQAIANFAIVATFFVYFRQLVAMRGQLDAARQASASQNFLSLIPFLQAPTLRESRGVLIKLRDKPYSLWTKAEREDAERACAAYDIAGILIRNGIIPKNLIIDNWGDSISKCHLAAKEYLVSTRAERGADYWDDFEWLAAESRRRGV
jgi:hypothetical protein